MIEEIIEILKIKKLPIEICNLILMFYLKCNENIKNKLSIYKYNIYHSLTIKNFHFLKSFKHCNLDQIKICFKCGNYFGANFYGTKINYWIFMTNYTSNLNKKSFFSFNYFFNKEKYTFKNDLRRNVKKIMCNCCMDMNYMNEAVKYISYINSN